MATHRLSQVRGNTKNIPITFKQSDGSLYCIKNWVIFFTLKTNINLEDSAASLQKIFTSFDDSTSGTSGSANITLAPSDTINLSPGEYDFDIKVTTNNNENFTPVKGKYTIEPEVTRSTGTAGTA